MLYPDGVPQAMYSYTRLPCGALAVHLASVEEQISSGYEPVYPEASTRYVDDLHHKAVVREHLFHARGECDGTKVE